jgi:hypothetical protein
MQTAHIIFYCNLSPMHPKRTALFLDKMFKNVSILWS